MGWETRKGKRYLYLKQREGGRSASRYVGAASAFGECHEASEAFGRERQQERERQWAVIRSEREKLDAVAGDVKAICGSIDTLVRACLILAGYHRHDRGPWRKRRKAERMTKNTAMIKMDDWQTVAQRLDALTAKANDGDAQAMQELQPLVQHSPALFERYGDLAGAVREALIQKISVGKALLIEDRVRARLAAMRQELVGPTPSPVEVLLVERILTCWLEVQLYDYRYITAEQITVQRGDYYQRRQDRAHQRYLSAIKALAQVRRLALPVMQVNIAQQQVNTLGPPAPRIVKHSEIDTIDTIASEE